MVESKRIDGGSGYSKPVVSALAPRKMRAGHMKPVIDKYAFPQKIRTETDLEYLNRAVEKAVELEKNENRNSGPKLRGISCYDSDVSDGKYRCYLLFIDKLAELYSILKSTAEYEALPEKERSELENKLHKLGSI
jgi:hypothetical protein